MNRTPRIMGSFNQALSVFALNTVFPDINSSQTAVRKVADDYLTEADDYGYSSDICAYDARVPQKTELEVRI